MPRVAWKPSNKDLKLIEEMASKGATQKAIYNALGIAQKTWYDYRKKHSENTQNTPSIKKAMESGHRRRREEFLKVAEDSILESIKVRKVIETTTTEGSNENGGFVNTKVVEKEVLPNPTILMFAAVNAENTPEGEPIKWQSINRVEPKQEQKDNAIKTEWVGADDYFDEGDK